MIFTAFIKIRAHSLKAHVILKLIKIKEEKIKMFIRK